MRRADRSQAVRVVLAAAISAAALAGCSAASGSTPPSAAQDRPAPGSCHARGAAGGRAPFTLPDPHCTPGAISRAVTQSNIDSTICTGWAGTGYTKEVRPPESTTEPEKKASLAAYGDSHPLHDYEYDHLIPLELGGAPNDMRNLWPEPGRSPNQKDRLEYRLRELVCHGRMKLATAQREIADNWVALYHRMIA